MSVDRNELLELYSISFEQARHHDRLYVQIWIGGIITLGIVVAALGSISGIITALALKSLVIGPVIGLGCLMILAFYWSICRHGREGRKCRDIARNIEDILVGKTPEEAIKINNLLVMRKVKEMRSLWDKDVWAPLIDPVGRLFFPVIVVAVWIVVCLVLAGYIG